MSQKKGVESGTVKGQSPVIRSVDVGRSRFDWREDGTLTLVLKEAGLASKVVTMFPLQWRALLQKASELTAALET